MGQNDRQTDRNKNYSPLQFHRYETNNIISFVCKLQFYMSKHHSVQWRQIKHQTLLFPKHSVHSLCLTFSEAVASLVPWALNASEAKGLSWAGIMATALCNEQPTRLCKKQNEIILIGLFVIINRSMNIQTEVIMNVY